ncbi:MAG TPA: type II toxin-antitoxin system VapC family toxin [Terriglobales bacterium]|nr:type II toxin-antitoxin system VapC family toxin [Terriglobales bacterium]
MFLDSSGMVKLYRSESGSRDVAMRLSQAEELGVSALSLTEVISALCRWRRENVLDGAQYRETKRQFQADWKDATVVELTAAVYGRAVHLLENWTLRSSDALQTACAIEWGADLFVSADSRQCTAARGAGLKVELLTVG